jgi:hypothetical protein
MLASTSKYGPCQDRGSRRALRGHVSFDCTSCARVCWRWPLARLHVRCPLSVSGFLPSWGLRFTRRTCIGQFCSLQRARVEGLPLTPPVWRIIGKRGNESEASHCTLAARPQGGLRCNRLCGRRATRICLSQSVTRSTLSCLSRSFQSTSLGRRC